MEAGQIPSDAYRAFQQLVQCRSPRCRLLSRLHPHLSRLLHTTLLPTGTGGVPTAIGRLDPGFLPRNERLYHLCWHFHTENRSLPGGDYIWLSLLDTRPWAFHQLPRPHQLAQNHHVPDHRRNRDRSKLSGASDCATNKRYTKGYGNCHLNILVRQNASWGDERGYWASDIPE